MNLHTHMTHLLITVCDDGRIAGLTGQVDEGPDEPNYGGCGDDEHQQHWDKASAIHCLTPVKIARQGAQGVLLAGFGFRDW